MGDPHAYLVAQPQKMAADARAEIDKFIAALEQRGAKIYGGTFAFGIIIAYDDIVGTEDTALENVPPGWYYVEAHSLADALEELSAGYTKGQVY